LQDKLAYSAANEAGMEAVFAALSADLPPMTTVERRTEVIKGVDGNDITLYIHTPKNVSGPLPCVYHMHGGGMVVLTASGPTYRRWRDELATLGMIAVGVEFRNGAGKLGNHPFPAGLNDCMSGLQWTFDHKATLGISKLIVSGESGGGNLSLAVCLKAKQDKTPNAYIKGATTDPRIAPLLGKRVRISSKCRPMSARRRRMRNKCMPMRIWRG
jgi:acetyl esterase/lipase